MSHNGSSVEILGPDPWPEDPGPPPPLARYGRGDHLTPDARRKAQAWILQRYATGDSLTAAASAAGLARKTVQNWQENDPEFGAAWREAEEVRADRLEREAWSRATEGYDNGKVVVKSDALLKLLLGAARPEKFGQRTEVHVSGGITLSPGTLAGAREAAEDRGVEAAAVRLLEAARGEGLE